MNLRTKFSLFIAVCTLLYFAVSTTTLTQFYTREQRLLLNDFQTSLALFTQKQLQVRMGLLYAELRPFLSDDPVPLQQILRAVAGASNGEVWEGEQLIAAHPKKLSKRAPVETNATWGIQACPPASKPPCLRWLGSFAKRTLILEIDAKWFKDLLESSHGSVTSLIGSDGTLLLQSGDKNGETERPVYFHSRAEIEKIVSKPYPMPSTHRYLSEDGYGYLGTFLRLSTTPPLVICVSTRWESVEALMRRGVARSTGVALAFLTLTILAGIIFSASLTRPLRYLAKQTTNIAHRVPVDRDDRTLTRRDEVGVLSRAFHKMTLDLKETEEELRRSERLAALGKFSAGVAHSVKNPLTGIISSAQLASREITEDQRMNPSEAVRAFELIREEAMRANRTIGQLMKFARQEKPPVEQLDMSERVGRSMAFLETAIREAGAQCSINVCKEAIFCIADGDQIHEALANLVHNAIHALRQSKEKKITVTLKKTQTHAVLKVSDSGCGMSPQTQSHLFEPFFTTKKIGEGTGLGLAMCRGIIENHRGKIEVESSEGKGTVFTILLPLADPSSIAKAA